MATRALILIEDGNRLSNGPLFVQAARRLGLHPTILSANPAQYDYVAEEDIQAVRVDTESLDALIRECSRLSVTYDIAGITSAAESFYAMAGRLSRHFNLPGPNPASVERCCDKFAQRRLLATAGVPMPAYRLASDQTEVERHAAEVGLPVILKPAEGRGSSGVRLCRNFDELAEHTAYLLGGKHVWQCSPRILVEEFAEGLHYCVDIMGNEVVGISHIDFGPLPHFVYHQVTYPAVLDSDKYDSIVDVSLNCLRTLGLGWGATCIELRWTERGPVVIEVNPRLGGGTAPQLVQLAYGVDLVTEHIKLVIGDEWNLCRKHSHTAAVRFLVPERDGFLDCIDGQSQSAAVPGVAEVRVYVEAKTSLVRKGDYRDCIGYVIATSSSHDQTEIILQHAVDLISFSITPFSGKRIGGASSV
ncbi:acetyl-CoA carboxylase biotin carboxylase subunit family protein [Mesorhizobium sp. VK9D]|uniref:ATP-grasp domain-containing protein n=1 Tax=Mesorhizobium australafricanum TaxID=3072311 RepID=UPI002A23BFCE|nr:acetyl-CoA carboxylase biotin carboxylase subunit family protein [Mesorhizobium sp. VK9D]MDX8455313.1 acetyl-CoA carboxylase biotin carboxylase subunit family protein [Mesorhizobium sp. VK9D]